MVDDPVFDHDGPWAEKAYLALSMNDGRIEVLDGTLLIGPDVSAHRSLVSARLADALTAALPPRLTLLRAPRLRLGLDRVLIPDFVVTNSTVAPKAPALLDAANALMVIEIIGSDHGEIDRRVKPQLYAHSGIPYSLLIDHDAPFATAEMIIAGRYLEYAGAGPGEVLRIEEPFRLELALGALTAAEQPAERSTPAAS